MSDDGYVKKCYVMLKCFADVGISNWASCIKNMLYSNGFGYGWFIFSVHSSRVMFHGLGFMVYISYSMSVVHGSRFMVQGSQFIQSKVYFSVNS